MPYKCVHCSAVYPNESKEVISGCAKCKSKFFFYVKEEKLKEIQESSDNESDLSASEKRQIEEEVREISGIENEDQTVFLDFESIRVLKPGKYLIDLSKLLLSNKPRVYQLEDGKYIVDLSASIRTGTS